MIGSWERVLVLAPHTDDGEFGAGGTMARLVEEGAEVRYVAFSIATRSLPEGFAPDTLAREVREATAELGIPESHLDVHDFEVRTSKSCTVRFSGEIPSSAVASFTSCASVSGGKPSGSDRVAMENAT